MAGCHLLFIFMYSFHKIHVQAVEQPKLKVNSPVITETDSVTLECRTWPSVTGSQCYFYILREENIRSGQCLQRLTGTELLMKSHQSSPAEVKVRCFYTVKNGQADYPSPHSQPASINILPGKQEVTEAAEVTVTYTMKTLAKTTASEGESQMPAVTPALTVSTGQTVSRYHASAPVTSVKTSVPGKQEVTEAADGDGAEVTVTHTMKTLTKTTASEGESQMPAATPALTVSTEGGTADKSSTKASFITTTTPNTPPETETWTWTWKLLVIAACFGGVIFLGLALLCTKGRTGRCSNKRTRASVTDDLPMRNLDQRGLLPACNEEAYSVITSAPSADCPTGSEKLKKQDSQDQEADIYHMYASISDEPPPSALKDMVYSTLQAH